MNSMMRTEAECLTKAAEMDRQAGQCVAPEMRAIWSAMAADWRDVAFRAGWQDAPRDADQISD